MAAPGRKMVGVSDDSSSSDDEELRRCQEAVWETQTNKTKDGDSSVKESKRIVVSNHEHDGNELQVTQGFQTHVAKKLGHFLDSCISEKQPATSSCVKSSQCNDDGDEGFRLFSTSVPGQEADPDPPVPVRRRPVPSSSDSDSEMEARLKEAAVSVSDFLPTSTPSAPCTEKVTKNKKLAEGEDSHVVKKKKKKKKKKQNQEESEQVDSTDSAPVAESNGKHKNSEQEHTEVEVKRKKKKRRKGNAEEEALN
ncbi:protein CUSTOS [Mugil cephalus]|uniref:protein CUSTOS n=1 Tax=Mugil cephalus TaxID=48193 RepID=UPI001FB6B49E|nr:protein CUSTOS [Mugil cephalus]